MVLVMFTKITANESIGDRFNVANAMLNIELKLTLK